jgi:hypothetical protein
MITKSYGKGNEYNAEYFSVPHPNDPEYPPDEEINRKVSQLKEVGYRNMRLQTDILFR